MEMIENMQMELWAKDKQLEAAKSSGKQVRKCLKFCFETLLSSTIRVIIVTTLYCCDV